MPSKRWLYKISNFAPEFGQAKPNERIRNRSRQEDYGFSLGGPVYIKEVEVGKAAKEARVTFLNLSTKARSWRESVSRILN
jgi:hypothetical protein